MKVPSAHEVVTDAVTGLGDRTRAAAYRVICQQPDPEAIHDFRVALRRMRTVLRAARRTYGKKRMRHFERALRRFGDATSALRDAEVLADTLALADLSEREQAAAQRWLEERGSHESELRAAANALIAGPELERTFAALRCELARGPKRDEPLPAFAEACLGTAQRGVGELLPVDPDDASRMHELRIRFKRLRYVAEMLRAMSHRLPKKRRKASEARLAVVARDGARMQKVLGRLHDVDEAIVTLGDSEAVALREQAPLRRSLEAVRADLVARAAERLASLPPEVVPDEQRLAS